jgi:hypothetical protein
MTTLTYRTNVLLTEQEHKLVSSIAERKEVSINQVIRDAIATLQGKGYSYEAERRKKALSALRDSAKHIDTKGINYRELVEEGRRY